MHNLLTKPKWVIMLLLLCFGFTLNAQKKLIVGTVTDKTNEPLAGVTVKVKGTKDGTITDFNGKYSIKATPNSTLIFSFLGMEAVEIKVNNQEVVNATLEDKSVQLNEAVAIGYGTARKRDLTGSVGKADIESMIKAPVASFDQALAGRVAGVVVTQSDGQPGSTSQITIRGGSVSQDTSPLYIIDGFPVENMDINSINPNDIESLEVLKDASSIAIYGARGANGVIIITTKRGTVSAPKVTYSFNMSVQHDIKRIKMMDPYNFVKMQIELDSVQSTPANLVHRFSDVYLDPANGITLDYYKTAKGYDWMNLLLRNGTVMNHSVNVTGGNNDTKYSVSASAFNQQGIIINTGMDKYDGKISLDQNMSKNAKFGLTANFSNTVTYGTIPSAGNGGGVIEGAWKYRPTSGAKGTDLLNFFYDPAANDDNTLSPSDFVNPVIQAQNELRKNTNTTGYVNTFLEYTFLKDFKLKISGGYNVTEAQREQFYNSSTAQGLILKNSLGNVVNTNGINGSYGNVINQGFLNENILNYKKKFNNNSVLDALVGFTYQYANTKNYSYSSINIPQATEYLQMASLVSGTATTPLSSTSKWQMYSLLSRVNYIIGDKYLFTGTIRSDGSSKFAPGHQWGYFPSGAVAWRFTNEPFMENLKTVLFDGKIRVSYGSVGNNRVNDFAYLSQFGNLQPIAGYPWNNNYQPGISPYFYGNKDITWETSNEFDLGANLSFFGDRLSIEADYYRKVTSNFLLSVNLPYMAGYSVGNNTQYQNTGEIENQGLEFTINTVNIKTKNFRWISNINISMNRSKILDFYSGYEVRPQTSGLYATPVAWLAKVGQPIAEFYGYKWAGCYQYSDFDKLANGTYVLKAGQATYSPNVQPGDAKYADINGDGKVDANDQTVIGHPLPLSTGGFNNTLIYGDFTLNVFFQWSYGNDALNANKYAFDQTGGYFMNGNQFADYENRWTSTNPSNDIPRLRYNAKQDIDNVTRLSSRLIEDASFIRLKTISVSYNVPQKLISKLRLKSLKFNASAQNLFTLTKYSGIDPEVSNFRSANPANSPFGSSGSTGSVASATSGTGYSFVQPSSSYAALSPGYDYSPYPPTMTINFGATISF